MKEKKLSFFFKLLFGIIILTLILKNVGIYDVISTIKMADFGLLILTLLVYSLNFLVGGINLKILLNQIKSKLGFFGVMKYYMLSWSLGLCVPGKVGEFSIIYFLKKHGISIGDGLVISIIDKLLTIFVFIIVSMFGFFLFFEKGIAMKMTFFSLVIFFILVFMIFSDFGRGLVKRFILRKYSKIFKGFSKTLFYYFRERKIILSLNLILTLLKLIVSSLAVSILFWSLGVNISIWYVMLITAIITIISLIPISISGLGIREASAVYLYGILGVNPEITFSVYLIFLFVNYFTALISILASKK